MIRTSTVDLEIVEFAELVDLVNVEFAELVDLVNKLRLRWRKKEDYKTIEKGKEEVIDARQQEILTAQKNIINYKEIQAHKRAIQAQRELDRISIRRFT